MDDPRVQPWEGAVALLGHWDGSKGKTLWINRGFWEQRTRTDARGKLDLETDIRDVLLVYDFMLPDAFLNNYSRLGLTRVVSELDRE